MEIPTDVFPPQKTEAHGADRDDHVCETLGKGSHSDETRGGHAQVFQRQEEGQDPRAHEEEEVG